MAHTKMLKPTPLGHFFNLPFGYTLTLGFSLPLSWSYGNTSSYAHPIIKILLKRIAICENVSLENVDYKEIYSRWLPEEIHEMEPASYILNNSWCKPRDIVRLITAAKNSIHRNSTAFTQALFNSIAKDYSEQSLTEIKEELRALYTPDEIDTIISCFMGYKTVFSTASLKQRIKTYYPKTVLKTRFNQVIEDLYRLGFLGNFLPASKTYRWQHRGDDRVILSDEWRLCVHYALHRALSIGSRQDYGQNRGKRPEVGDNVKATVIKVIKSFALVEFNCFGKVYSGSIHISEFEKLGYGYIENLGKIVHKGEDFDAVIGGYSDIYKNWQLNLCVEVES